MLTETTCSVKPSRLPPHAAYSTLQVSAHPRPFTLALKSGRPMAADQRPSEAAWRINNFWTRLKVEWLAWICRWGRLGG